MPKPKEIIMSPEQQITNTIEEIKNIVSVHKGRVSQEIIEMYFQIGETVYTSPLYKKDAKGAGKYVTEIARRAEIAPSVLYAAIKAYLHFGTAYNCQEQLTKMLGKPYVNWSDIKRAMVPEKELQEPKCHHCPLHCSHPGA